MLRRIVTLSAFLAAGTAAAASPVTCLDTAVPLSAGGTPAAPVCAPARAGDLHASGARAPEGCAIEPFDRLAALHRSIRDGGLGALGRQPNAIGAHLAAPALQRGGVCRARP